MTNAVLIFTFSPVQSFIAEARRSEDLFNGSAILSRLAWAAGKAIGESAGKLIYPADLQKHNAPNVLVARVSQEQAQEIAQKARQALLKEWQVIAEAARKKARLEEDDHWQRTWKRQIVEAPPWQIFWAVAPETEGYARAYETARDLLKRAKRSRLFAQSEEDGEKDSLSGARTALRTQKYGTAREYWEAMSKKPHILPSQVRPKGRELLDSIGLVKRFWEGGEREFPSTSTVAAWDFYQEAQKKAPDELNRYREALEALPLYKARKSDAVFPYDGDLFFEETLTCERMESSYNVKVDEATLQQLRVLLKDVVRKTDKSPSPYYMLIQFDGDGVGAKIDDLLKNDEKAEENHRCFSQKLADFSGKVQEIVKPEEGGFLIYNGGDDVFFMASREKGLELARRLAEEYQKIMCEESKNPATASEERHGCEELKILATASAGVAIVHHLTPLARGLSLMREAERSAKVGKKDELGNKEMVCVTLAKRGGEALSALSPWKHVAQVAEWVQAFQNDEVASVFPYLLARETAMLQNSEQEVKTSILRYLFNRHTSEKVSEDRKHELLNTLNEWRQAIEKKTESYAISEIARWLIIAQFLASGGAE